MEPVKVRSKILDQIQNMVDSAIIKDRRFLDDEQLIRAEQLAVLEEIFNANVRDTEIKELASHFAGIFRDNHPCHLAIWGKTGTGKTLTVSYFLNLLSEMCQQQNIPLRNEHLDLGGRRQHVPPDAAIPAQTDRRVSNRIDHHIWHSGC